MVFSMPRLAAFGAVAALAACGGSAAYAPSSGGAPFASTAVSRPDAALPGNSALGVSAHYVVFARKISTGSSTIDVIAVQETASYQKAFRLTSRLTGASVEYPDASRQGVNANAEFDAGASSYAQAHPEPLNGKDVVIRVHPPNGTGLKTITTTIFVPSKAEEGKIVSGVIPPESDSPLEVGNAAVWSCDPKNYGAKTLQVVKPNQLDGYSFAVDNETVWYRQEFFTCGTGRASNRILWSAARWEHISAGFGTNAHTRWSLNFIPDRFYGDEVALSAKPSDPSFPDRHLALFGQ